MGALVLAVPLLLVVVLGYTIGYTVWEATGLGGDPELVGWLTGLVLLGAVTWLALRAWRRRRERG